MKTVWVDLVALLMEVCPWGGSGLWGFKTLKPFPFYACRDENSQLFQLPHFLTGRVTDSVVVIFYQSNGKVTKILRNYPKAGRDEPLYGWFPPSPNPLRLILPPPLNN